MSNIDQVVVWLRGGLGNQLFQHAAGALLARSFGLELVNRSDLLPRAPDSFSGVSRWPEQIGSFDSWGTVRRKTFQPFEQTSFSSKVWTIQTALAERFGYSPPGRKILLDSNLATVCSPELRNLPVRSKVLDLRGYFISSEPAFRLGEELRERLRAVTQPSPEYLLLVNKISGCFAVHVRLGDHLTLDRSVIDRHKTRLNHSLRSAEIRRGAPIALFSDQVEIAAPLLESVGIREFVSVPDAALQPIEVLNLMGYCQGLVGGQSTFAWWARFLQGEVRQ